MFGEILFSFLAASILVNVVWELYLYVNERRKKRVPTNPDEWIEDMLIPRGHTKQEAREALEEMIQERRLNYNDNNKKTVVLKILIRRHLREKYGN